MNILRVVRIPDLFSLLNALSGFCAILAASRDEIGFSVLLVIISAVLDGIDGFLARNTKSSEIGFSLDSLADVVSFGVAPAVITVIAFHFSVYALAASLIYLVCGTLRLARFNASDKDDKFFEGYPITASGMATAACILLDRPLLAYSLMLILSVLMISSIPYPKIRDMRLVAALVLVLIISAILNRFVSDATLSGTLILAAMIAYIVSPVVNSCQQKER